MILVASMVSLVGTVESALVFFAVTLFFYVCFYLSNKLENRIASDFWNPEKAAEFSSSNFFVLYSSRNSRLGSCRQVRDIQNDVVCEIIQNGPFNYSWYFKAEGSFYELIFEGKFYNEAPVSIYRKIDKENRRLVAKYEISGIGSALNESSLALVDGRHLKIEGVVDFLKNSPRIFEGEKSVGKLFESEGKACLVTDGSLPDFINYATLFLKGARFVKG